MIHIAQGFHFVQEVTRRTMEGVTNHLENDWRFSEEILQYLLAYIIFLVGISNLIILLEFYLIGYQKGPKARAPNLNSG